MYDKVGRKPPYLGVLVKWCSENMQVILAKLLIEITLRVECSPVNLLHIFGTHFPKNTSAGLLLVEVKSKRNII